MWFATLLTSSVLLASSFVRSEPEGGFAPRLDSTGNCALIIPGGSKSSAFDGHSSFSGGGGDTCITYEAVNAAFEESKGLVGLPPIQDFNNVTNDDIANLAAVIQETTRSIAKQYGLSKEAIYSGLPLIDTTKTNIINYCPAFLTTTPEQCQVQRYRAIGGLCNNLQHPLWTTARVHHHRFIPPDFADGVSAPRISVTGKALPAARLVSTSVHHDHGHHDHAATIFLVIWGQFMDHDLTLTAETRDPLTNKAPKCCEGAVHPNCFPIEVPENDPFYSVHQQRCINLSRSPPGLRSNCRLGPRAGFNLVASVIDASTVYGDNQEIYGMLRSFEGGFLKMLPVFDEFNMKPLLPLRLENPDEGCIRPGEDVYCFLAGDARVNEQTVLCTIHTLLFREHNRIAKEMAEINPHWNDETLFQETRHIVAAQVQHITYNEWLPMVLGKKVMEQFGLILLKDGYFDGYDPEVNPTVANGFATAAFRLGHTLLPSTIERWSPSHRYVGSQRLSDLLMQPYDLFKGGWIDTYLMGLSNQVAQAYDQDITQEVTNHLFQEPGKKFGLDLISLNMQRGREHGIPTYNRYREFCGFHTLRHWDDLIGIFRNETVVAYSKVYASPDDIDLWSAGVSEIPNKGTLIGPTFACMFGNMFHNLRYGDRFWHENGGWPSSFTLEQLAEIRKVKLSRLVCENTDHVETIQVYPMVLPDHEINPRIACKSGILPRLDLTKWKDASFHTSPFQPFK